MILFSKFQIVSKSLSEPIRSHKDLDKGSAPLYNKAVKFYEDISKQLVNQGHVLDLFACALDQVCCLLFLLFLIFYENLVLFAWFWLFS